MIRTDKLTERERKFCIIVISTGLVIFFGCCILDNIFHIADMYNTGNFIYILGGVGLGFSFAPFFMGE
jgi:hypothetical protein